MLNLTQYVKIFEGGNYKYIRTSLRKSFWTYLLFLIK